MKTIAENLFDVRERIAQAARQAGRDKSEVTLIAISKTKPLEMIAEAFAAGQTTFGENYVLEAVEKAARFPQAEWHLVGSLQTNKIKYLAGHFSLIQSVDRFKLAAGLEAAAARAGRVQDILLQIHIGEESNKQGASVGEAPSLIEDLQRQPHLRLRGLMSLPPLSEDERTARGYFASLRVAMENWRTQMTREQAAHFTVLSMGTSGDYEWAVKEGATMVRVGTAIFGARA